MVEAKNMQAFLTFSAVASDDTLGNNLKSSNYLHRLSDQEDRQKKDKYNEIIKFRTSVTGKNGKSETGNPRTD